MKFAKYQQNNLVPEWRAKYLDYKKGKKLLKEVKKARWRQLSRTPSAPSPQTPDGNDADSEDAASLPRTSSYGTIGKNNGTIRQRSPLPSRPEDIVAATDTGQPAPLVESPPQISTGSDDSTTPIAPVPRSRSRRVPTMPKTIPPAHRTNTIRQVFDTIRRGRKGTADSLEGVRLASEDDEFDDTEVFFLHWLDGEIKKIDDFYIEKEHDADERYKVLSAQLEALRRLRDTTREDSNGPSESVSREDTIGEGFSSGIWMSRPITRLRASFDGLRSAMPQADHERRAKQPELMAHPISTTTGYVEYRVAKRRLKQAVLEFYRGMELLKNYRLLNRTGITKILKKFDKTAGRKMSAEYTEKLKSVHFECSEDLEKIMERTEDMFARYFERNNRKNAVERLRSKDKPNEHVPAVFNVGLLLGLTIPFFLEGIVESRKPSTGINIPQAGYLMQVWGGFALVVLFLLLFGINSWVWHDAKINYTFIFEFDTKHHLDYRQYLELPTFLAFLGSVLFWLTFKNFWPNQLYATWYPLIFVCITLGMWAFPFRTLHRSSRSWFAIANFRILFSGIYAIEFRDFFLGDQYNSLIYSFANIPLFFCLYAKSWSPNALTVCNSSHSRLLGFFTTLPPIWRFLQCIRRYIDTKHYFPHLVNAGKYSATILMYTFLSLWRIDDTVVYQALFILFAAINTLYTSWWDLFMDWSLMQPHAPHPFLRSDLGYKRIWPYYAAIVIDPIMRSSWIFYVAFPGQKQHSAATSFFIAFGEVFRRFMWNFFRMENEHMTNVGHFLASRDVPLPFHLPATPSTPPSGPALEAQPRPNKSLTMRTMGSMRRGMVRMTSSLHGKHAEDFARRPGMENGPSKGDMPDELSSDENGSQEEDELRRISEEHRNDEMRNVVEMDDLHENQGQI